MAIPDYMKQRFDVLQKAMKAGDLALMETTKSSSGDVVYLLAAVDRRHGGLITPLGELCADENPYDTYEDPAR